MRCGPAFLKATLLAVGLLLTACVPSGPSPRPDFYSDPGVVEGYANGQLIRSEEVPAASLAPAISAALGRGVRVMYRSQATSGAAIAATGLVLVPKGSAPADGWPVVVWAHGTVGVSGACAPSKTANLFFDDYGAFAGHWLARGHLVVAIDYQGLGIAGQLHPYVEMASEANTATDGVRAARALGIGAWNRWVVIGHSQGGQAALGTGELAPARAPELDLRGVVSIAPGTSMLAAVGHIERVGEYYDLLGFVATSIKLGDPSFDYGELLGPDLIGEIGRMQSTCSPIPFARLAHPVNPAYARSPAVQAFARRNQPGHARSAAPILLVTGAKDALIVQASVDRRARDLKAVGDSVTYRVHANDDHNTIVESATPEIDRWVTERFAVP